MTFDMQAASICAVTNGADTRTALKAALGEIERWQKIAIEERAKVLAWERVEKDAPHWTEMVEQAAKELDIRASQEANYMERLEAAYVDMVFRATGSDDDAQAALAKIREGKI